MEIDRKVNKKAFQWKANHLPGYSAGYTVNNFEHVRETLCKNGGQTDSTENVTLVTPLAGGKKRQHKNAFQ